MAVNRRDTLKTLLIGGIAVSALPGCKSEERIEEEKDQQSSENTQLYGRTAEEKIRDQELMNAPSFFTEQEAATLAILVDIICPADDISGSASDSDVMEFLEFIVKDMNYHQMPLRSGLAWLSRESQKRFGKSFDTLSQQQLLAIIDDIAYPEETLPKNKPGEKFFTHLRNLALTGFYTSEIGLKDLGYMGNRPNFWDGVPDEVLKEHGLSYEKKYVNQYITEEKRVNAAQWDDDGNLI